MPEELRPPPIDRLPEPALVVGRRRITDASGGECPHIYAGTGCVTLQLPLAGPLEVDEAVREAGTALSRWRAEGARERGRALYALGETIRDRSEEFATIQTLETGMPVAFSESIPEMAAEYFLYNAGLADKLGGTVVPTGSSALDYVVEEPYGVVGVIVPWNASLTASCQALAPVLATGNTVVLKPPEFAPFASLRLAELALEVGIPPGVINVVVGRGAAGESLVRHPGISKIHFTGSRETARLVLVAAASNIVPVCVELGGKSPLMVFQDADLLAAAQLSMTAIVGLSGQGCALPTRVLVEKEVYGRFVTILKGLLRRLTVGDPLAPATQVGPLVSNDACQRVVQLIDRAQAEQQGTLVAGGKRMDGKLANGFFVAPTIFTEVDEESELAMEEIFGPVLSLMCFEGEEDALRLANRSAYGLAAYVFTNDLGRAHRISAGLEVGAVWINGSAGLAPGMPFGGYKQSGYGRLGGSAGLKEFTRPKNVWVSLEAPPPRA